MALSGHSVINHVGPSIGVSGVPRFGAGALRRSPGLTARSRLVLYRIDQPYRIMTCRRIAPSLWGRKPLEPTVGPLVGFTPLVKADRLAKALGIAELYVKTTP